MIGEVLVICSMADPASTNIAARLLELEDWDEHSGYRSHRNYRMLCLDRELIRESGLDERIADLGLRPDILIFASRHKARYERRWLGGHFTGNTGEALLGGKPRELAVAAPAALKSFLLHLARAVPPGFEISAEATHHGPSDVRTPSFFAEIGSAESEWRDAGAGAIVARSILALELSDLPIFLGFGGGHYVHRQTRLLLETKIAFGHLFSSYQISDIDIEVVEDARLKSNASYAYVDRKSLESKSKKKVEEILESLGLEQLREKEIRERFPLKC
jgi:D-aminoacyl-tRNA deacylase